MHVVNINIHIAEYNGHGEVNVDMNETTQNVHIVMLESGHNGKNGRGELLETMNLTIHGFYFLIFQQASPKMCAKVMEVSCEGYMEDAAEINCNLNVYCVGGLDTSVVAYARAVHHGVGRFDFLFDYPASSFPDGSRWRTRRSSKGGDKNDTCHDILCSVRFGNFRYDLQVLAKFPQHYLRANEVATVAAELDSQTKRDGPLTL
ncbi:hypothetical protein Tco_0674619 [Tanacetum coccineum]